MSFHFPEAFRIRSGHMASSLEVHGHNGAAFIPNPRSRTRAPLKVIATDGTGLGEAAVRWEHVSVSLPDRCPTWEEMCRVKDLFWDAEDTVMQLHPPASEYVNNHPFCLHLWRPMSGGLELIVRPPPELVGWRDLGLLR